MWFRYLLVFSALLPVAASADWAFCHLPRWVEPFNNSAQIETLDELSVSADQMTWVDKKHAELSGHVVLSRMSDELRADSAQYDLTQQHFLLEGNVNYRNADLQAQANSMDFVQERERIEFQKAQFYIFSHNANGSAARIFSENNVTTLEEPTYSTCDPEERDWYLKASKITLDKTEGTGTVKHMRVFVKDVPVFYFPYMSFPIDDKRKSGFLLPTFGHTSASGFEFSLPYYWNIAAQADATLTSHYLANRGFQAQTEWRYLNNWSHNQLDAEYLDDRKTNDARQLLRLRHDGNLSGRFFDRWRTYIDATEVSDSEYFSDLGNELSLSSLTHVQRTAGLVGEGDSWILETKVLDYQTLDTSIAAEDEPYRLAPQIKLTGLPPDWRGLRSDASVEMIEFQHPVNPDTLRTDIDTRLGYRLGDHGWYIEPAIAPRYTEYRITNTANDTSTLSRHLNVQSVDAGFILERDFNDTTIQTLEPRIFYLHTPYRNQDDIPILDTDLREFSFSQLFATNRYTGADRIGDTQQTTVALSSRWLDTNSGEEQFSFQVGRIYYAVTPQVRLPDEPIIQQDHDSDWVAEAALRLQKVWYLSTTWVRDPDTESDQQRLFRAQYKPDAQHVINFSYRYFIDELEQTDISLRWPITAHWYALGRWNHSLRAGEEDPEILMGLEYESCCYGVRLASRRYLDNGELKDGIYFQLVLKGFTRFGDDLGGLLERNVIGFEETLK